MSAFVPGSDEFEAVVRDENPWHVDGSVAASLSHPETPRPLSRYLWQAVRDESLRRDAVIVGPRRVGKTTAMYGTIDSLLSAGIDRDRLWWLRLDHPTLLRHELGHLVRYVVAQGNATLERPAYLFLDEVTETKDWARWLKTFYDDKWPVRIVGSSSCTTALRDGTVESGIGRWAEHHMPPYLFTEYLDLIGEASTPVTAGATLAETLTEAVARHAGRPFRKLDRHRVRYMLIGGFPELLVGSDPDERTAITRSQRILKDQAVNRTLYVDLPKTRAIDQPTKLERLLLTLADQIAMQLSSTSIGNDCGLSQPTVDRYLHFLEQAFLIFRLPNYARTEAARQRRGRKLYFVDGAIRNAALLRGTLPLSNPKELGHLTENLVAAHLHALAGQAQTRLCHWREGKREIDFIYDDPNGPVAVEVTTSAKHSIAALTEFATRFPSFRDRCYLVGGTSEVRPAEGTTPGHVPIDLFLQCVGRQEHADLARRLDATLGRLPFHASD